MRKRVGITQRVVAVPERGERRDALDQRWFDWVDRSRYLLVPLPNRGDGGSIVADVVDLQLDGFLLSGGNDLAVDGSAGDVAPERDRLERELLAFARAHRVPVFGVCRGMQMLLHESGAELRRIDGHAGTSHRIVQTSSDWPISDGRIVNSYHDWAIDRSAIRADWNPLAVAVDTDGETIEAVAHRESPFVGVMWHPERDRRDAIDRALFDRLFGNDR
jgi:N5-(cytidine 5'-diphosphoramidyl)-L-glutamine hydrolase